MDVSFRPFLLYRRETLCSLPPPFSFIIRHYAVYYPLFGHYAVLPFVFSDTMQSIYNLAETLCSLQTSFVLLVSLSLLREFICCFFSAYIRS